jgi:ribosome-associated heat shock protein Hsp15
VQAPEKVRLDKYLWAIRVFKTRSLAAVACDKGRVKMQNVALKASHSVKIGEVYTIRIETDYSRTLEVLRLSEKRQAYSIVRDYFSELGPPPPKKDFIPAAFVLPQAKREKGSGRPTKKERRNLGKSGWL